MSALSVVHEPACQRRHFRVTTPAEVGIGGARYQTSDWSLGGFKIVRYDGAAQPGDRIPIHFWLDFQRFGVSFDATAEVVRREGDSLAAKFVGLGERESELLRQFVAAITSGQMVAVDGVLKHLDRPVTKTPFSIAPERAGAPPKRVIRRFIIAGIYLLAGVLVGGYALLTVGGLVMRVNVDTAVTSMPLEQIVSTDVGAIRELYVQPGAQVTSGQPLFRVDSELAERNVELARQELKSAEIDVREAESATEQEKSKLAAYRAISNDQREAGEAKIRSLSATRDEERTEFERVKKLWEYKLISRQLYDAQEATLAKHEALVEQAVAEQKIAESSSQTVNSGYFFSGNFLVGDLPARIAAEAAARERLALAQVVLEETMNHVSRRVYRAPFPAVVTRVFKSSGMTVDRGEALMVLRRAGEEAHVDAYLTQDEAAWLGAGTRGVAFIPAQGKHYAVEVLAVDRTSGFLKDIQTPKLAQPQYSWRSLQDRSAYAKLAFVCVSPGDLAAIAPGLPVRLSVPKKRDFSFSLLPSVHAASNSASSQAGSWPRLWPPQSALFRHDRPVAGPNFEPVRQRVIETADRALHSTAAPVEILHSAGETDKTSPEFVRSRRAFQDADNFALLALAYKLTGREEYLGAAREILNSWARVNQPTGNPIDETRLEGFLWGLDLIGPAAESPAVEAWLNGWQAADRNWRFGPNTETNNHKTHHLKTLLMLDRVLGRTDDYARDRAEAERHVKANLGSADGSSLDYRQRDAMHYHIYDLEAWNEIALITGCCGPELDRAFRFFEQTMREHPEHREFANSTAPIDRKRAAAGFGYARAQAYDVRKAARAIFSYATLPGRQVPQELWQAALDGGTHSNLFYQARYYLWRAEN